MLTHIHIKNFAVVEDVAIDFDTGMTVITGETGAGKSILLDSLGFVLGWRGRAELVRSGAEQGEVTAVFDLPKGHPAHDVLAEAGFEDADELILRRVNTADGRKTGWVNDRRVTGEMLRALSDTLVELHGQHDDRGLLDSKGHRALLDQFAGHDDLLAAVKTAWSAMSKARKALTEAEAAYKAAQAEEEFLRHSVGELDKLSPEPGEDAELDARRRLMQASERIRDDIARRLAALDR